MMAHVVDLLSTVKPAELWAREGRTLAMLAGVMAASVGVAGLWALIKYQAACSATSRCGCAGTSTA
jgi:ATP-binding cassette subfamily B multidrug efflux pump